MDEYEINELVGIIKSLEEQLGEYKKFVEDAADMGSLNAINLLKKYEEEK